MDSIHSGHSDSIAAGGTGYNKWPQLEQARQVRRPSRTQSGTSTRRPGCVEGCRSNPRGQGADILNKSGSWCAELKNKFNTTKGNHKGAVHEDIERWVHHYEEKYGQEFTGYYCYVIPRTPGDIDQIWHFSGYHNPKIREITYAALLDKATGVKDSLRKLYLCLPTLLEKEFSTATKMKVKHMKMPRRTFVNPLHQPHNRHPMAFRLFKDDPDDPPRCEVSADSRQQGLLVSARQEKGGCLRRPHEASPVRDVRYASIPRRTTTLLRICSFGRMASCWTGR